VFDPIDLVNDALKQWFGIEKPKIAVAALNPHAGEAGKFGDEEKRIISPAILMAQEVGIKVEGPFPADTLFHQALKGKFDAIVAMYHDQGLIPLKMLAFDKAVNITIGLPIIRTSPDHGTAFDIVGQNQANPDSMKAAIHMACDMVEVKKRNKQKA
jgi:4-hydroxythreonine-4-phosphate dehydrogenase